MILLHNHAGCHKRWPLGGRSQIRRPATILKLTGTGGQTDRQTDRQTDGLDHVLSQADALTKNYETGNRSARVQD